MGYVAPMPKPIKSLGVLLRKVRENQGLTLREAADLCGCTAGYLTKCETGQPVSAVKAARLAVAMGLKKSEAEKLFLRL
jgi:transcriptional regulator with XRE-family HTH domain